MNYTFKISTDNKGAITAINEIKNQVGGLQDKIKSSTDQMNNNFNKSFMGLNSSLKSLIGGFAAFEGIKSFFNLGTQAQENQILFEGMAGSAEKGQALLTALQQYATVTKLTSQEVKQGAQYLFNYGDAYENILPDVKLLADASGGNAEKFRLMAYGFGQVVAAGRLMGQEARQLTDAGFNPLQEISRTTGESMLSLKQKMEAGLVSVDMVRKSFISATSEGGRFYKLQERLNKGVGGQWSNLVDRTQLKLIDLFKKLTPLFYDGINALSRLADIALPTLEVIGNVLLKIVNILKEIWPVLKYIVGLFLLWKSAQVINSLILGSITLYNSLIKLPELITSIGLGFNSWVLPIMAAVAAISALIVAKEQNAKVDEYTETANNIKNLRDTLRDYEKKGIKSTTKEYTDIFNLLVDQLEKAEKLKSEMGKDTFWDFIKSGYKNLIKDMLSGVNDVIANQKNPQLPGQTGIGAAAYNTSMLSGAQGGLGEAKVIHLHFNKALIENNIPGGNGSDIIAKSPQAAELILRVLNNIAPSQGTTF